MAVQDFTGWVPGELDPESRITVIPNKVSWVDMPWDELCYHVDDKGANYFSGSFIHDFTVNMSAVNYGYAIHWGLSNSLGTWKDILDADGDELMVMTGQTSGPLNRLWIFENYGGVDQQIGLAINVATTYYIRIIRNETIGTYGRLRVEVYSDSARTALVTSGNLTLHKKTDFRYLYACQNRGYAGTGKQSGYSEDLDIDVAGNPSVTTQAVTAILEHTATGNGNITSIGMGAVTQHGVVYSDNVSTPTLDNSLHTEEGAAAGTGAFTSGMTDLKRKTKYYVRAYATNTFGTGYGGVHTFYTDPNAIVSMAFNQSIFTEAPDWDDVSGDVIGFDTKRGRNHDLDRIEAGTAILTLKNLDGNYWRYNTTGDYYPYVKPLSLVRISAVWGGITYRRFYGLIESFKHSWIDDRGGKIPIVTVSCVDLFKSLTRLKLQSLPGTIGSYTSTVALASNAAAAQKDVVIKSLADSATEGCDIALLHVGQSVTIKDNSASEVNTIASIDVDTYTLTMTNNLANAYATAADAHVKKFPAVVSGTRVADVLYEFGWPASLTALDTGVVTVIEYVPAAGGEAALGHLQAVAESDGGIVFVALDGKVTFQDRDKRLSSPFNTAQATFSDDGEDQKYVMAKPEDDDSLIYNEAIIDGAGITGQLYRDVTAQASQGARGLSRTSSLISANANAFDQAYTIVNRYKDSVLRVPSMLVIPDADAANLYPKVLLYDISTRINLELKTAPNIANLDKDYHIEGIVDRYRAGKLWETTWQLWDVNLFRIFQATHDGYFHKEDLVSYANAHDAAEADDVYNDNTVITVGQFLDGAADWRIWRGFLQFDTSDIGAAGSIARAELIMEIMGFFVEDNEWALTLVAAGAGVENPLVVGDYGTMVSSTTSYGSVTVTTPAINKKIIIITLNATGIAAINKTGTTYFGLRSSKDIADTSPGANDGEWLALEGVGSSFVPRLVVELNEA